MQDREALSDAATSDSGGWTRLEQGAVVLGALGTAVLLLVAVSGHGIGLNTDSVGYKATADNLVAGDGLTWWGDADYVVWPPLYPALLALGALLSPLTTEDFGLVLNLMLRMAIVVEAAVLLRRSVSDLRLRVLGILLVAVAPVLHVMARMLWTESLFIALVLGALIALQRASDEGSEDEAPAAHSGRWFAAAVVLVWLAFLTRYIGLSLAVAGGVTFLVLPRRRPLRGRALSAALFVGASVAIPALWLVRNRAVNGTLMGPRSSTDKTLVANAGDAVEGFGKLTSWYPGSVHPVLGAAVVVGFILLAVAVWRLADPPRPFLWAALGRRGALLPLLAFAFVYVAMLLVTRTLVGFVPLSDRLLAPSFVPILVVVLSWLDALNTSRRVPRGVVLGVLGLLSVWLLVLAGSSARLSVKQARNGTVLASDAYARAPLAEFVRDAEARGCRVYTNERPALFLWTGTEAELTPRRTAHWSDDPVGDLAKLERVVQREPVCLLWIDLVAESRYLSPRELDEVLEVTEVRRDGAVSLYEVGP